jgi:metal-responsive CopG/Arc/MetJ family transcriptional regulator
MIFYSRRMNEMFGNNVKLDRDLVERCKEHAKRSGYSSVEEFIMHTLEKELKKSETQSRKGTEEVAKRLRGLGYID